MKNKKIKKVAITLTAFLIVGGNIIPSMTAFASENNVKIEDTVTQNNVFDENYKMNEVCLLHLLPCSVFLFLTQADLGSGQMQGFRWAPDCLEFSLQRMGASPRQLALH